MKNSKPKAWMTVATYPSRGKRYFRFMWGNGDTVHGQVHINGGNIRRSLAKQRAARIQKLIDEDASLLHILELLRGYSAAKHGRR